MRACVALLFDVDVKINPFYTSTPELRRGVCNGGSIHVLSVILNYHE